MSFRPFWSPPVVRPGPRRVLTGILAGAVVAGVLHAPPASAAAPTVGAVAPKTVSAGHGVTVAGTNLLDATQVVFAGDAASALDDVAATSFRVLSATSIVAQVPAGAVTGAVRVTTPDGASTSALPVTVQRAPVIDSLSVTAGRTGDLVEVAGSELGPTRKVTIAGRPASVMLLPKPTSTALTVKVPAGLAGGPTELVVTTPGGSVSTPFYVGPDLKGVAPKVGTTAGGGVVTLSGSGFTGTDLVTFGGVPAAMTISVTDKQLVVEAPAGVTGPAPVVVRTRSGARTAESGSTLSYTYQPLPAVTGMSRNWQEVTSAADATAGTAAEPLPVTLTGKNLTQDTKVLFGSVQVTPTVDLTAGTLTFSPPVSTTAKAVTIALTNTVAGLPYKTTVPFAYVVAPQVNGVSPASAPAGATVTIAGSGFVAGTTARFGAAAASCTVASFTSLKCVVPGGTGTANVTVTTPLGTAPLPAAVQRVFTYVDGVPVPPPAPKVRTLLPAMGLPGTAVAVSGTDLGLVTAVRFPAAAGGWVDAPDFLVVSASRLVVRVPAGAGSGPLELSQVSGPAVSSGLVRYLAVAAPSLSSIDAIGDSTYGVVGGDTVILRGAGLVAGLVKPAVTVGGVKAAVLLSPAPTPTSVAIKVPASAGRRAPVVVTTPFGSASAALQLYYVPQVLGASNVTLPGGRVGVNVTGTGFSGAHAVTSGAGRLTAVTFGGVPAEDVVVVNDKKLLAVPAPGSDRADGVVVRTQHQGWTGTSESVVTPLDLPIPTVAGLTPDVAVLGDAPREVTISGTNLRADSVVRFGTERAGFVSVASDGRSMRVVPPVRSSAGSVTVTVTNTIYGEAHTATVADGFRYLPVPSIAAVSPSTGQTGTAPAAVTITGKNLMPNSVVRFGDSAATVQGAADDGTSMVVLPPLSNQSGSVDVTVTNIVDGESLTATRGGGYLYALSPANLETMSATTGDPGTPVTLTGTSFVNVTKVHFGTHEVPFTVANSSTVFLTVPSTPTGQGGSTVSVSLVNGTGSPSTGSLTWTWSARPTVTSLSQSTGGSGTTITVTGTGFTGATAVRFGGVAGLTPVVLDDTRLTVQVPSTPAGGGVADVAVVTPGGTSGEPYPATANDWTWAPIAAISRMSPSSGTAGTTVTVTGRHFLGTRTVTAGGAAVSNLVVTSDTSLSFTVPLPKNSSKPVVITNRSGASSTADTTGANVFTWIP